MSDKLTGTKALWGKTPSWMPKESAKFSKAQKKQLLTYEQALSEQLSAKPARFSHSLSVSYTAERMALAYGADPYEARVAGMLHDWSKALSAEAQHAEAERLGLTFGVELDLVKPLLHGSIAARVLPSVFPELTPSVLQAIDRHTLGASDMTALDMVIFVADGIEPLRKKNAVLDAQRKMVGNASLEELYWQSFSDGVAYVIDTRRYLYPGTLKIYNDHVLADASNK